MSYSLLIVDDSKSALFMAEKTVRLSGIPIKTILTAENGKQAIQVLQDHQVDLIMTDINMPEMDGFQLLEYLKVHEKLKSVPVLMITTEGREKYINRARKMGAEEYIKKPFLPEQVRQIVMETLGVRPDGIDMPVSDTSDF